MTLKRVWEPLKVGPIELKNRIVRTATTTRLFPPGIDDDFIGHHVATARGGAGLSILDGTGVHPNSYVSYLVDESAIPDLQRLVTAVQPYGTRLFQQLWHGGHNGSDLVTGQIPWGASALPGPLSGIVPVPMGQRDIDELVASFANAACCCREAGLDGVEIHAGHGYLINQFLSPLTNKREDGYNGGLLDRARFLIEVLQAVRTATGGSFALGVRLSPSTAVGGLSGEDVAAIALHLETLGLIDYVNLSFSDYFNLGMILADMANPEGYELPHNAATLASITKVPRLVTGRFRTLDDVEQVLRDGKADLVALTRQHIADPNIVRKTQEGRTEDVRPCIACLQGCLGTLMATGRMQCTVNPAAGFESVLDEEHISKVDTPQRVMIVGGGPAGMEAARVAALLGHDVSLFEAGARLGGTLLVAKQAPQLHILGDLTDWLERQIYKLSVDVNMGSYIEADDVARFAPDVLIIATGAMNEGDGRQAMIPGELPYGMDLPHVMDASEAVLLPAANIRGKRAVVFDDVGRYQAIAAAEHLVRAGADVTFCTSHSSFAPKMTFTFREDSAQRRMHKGDFRILVHHYLIGINPEHCHVRPFGSSKSESIAADIAVVVTTPSPLRNLFDEMRDSIPIIHLVGDAQSPADLYAAMRSGHRAARTLVPQLAVEVV